MALGPLGLIDLDDPPPTLAHRVIDFAEEYVRIPSGPQAGEPLLLTPEQIEFLIVWYAVWPDGRSYVHTRGMLEGPKGWSKSPIGAVGALWDLVGEVIPDGLDADGQPVGRPHPNPRIQIAGTSEGNTDNLYMQMHDSIESSPVLDDFGIDLGTTKTTLKYGPGIIEPVTSSSATRQGNPVSSIYREETHEWRVSNGGVMLAGTMNRNARKGRARVLDLTNCYVPGAGSVAESFVAATEKGKPRLLVRVRSKIEVPDINDTPVARAALQDIYGSHVRRELELDDGTVDVEGWIDIDELLDDRPPGDTTEEEWRRFFLNEETGEAESVLDVAHWKELADVDAELVDGDTIGVGFDGSDTGDATALYACRYPDWCLFKIAVWEHPRDPQSGEPVKGWKVPRAEVRRVLRRTMRRYNVVRGYADPAYWQTDIDAIAAKFGDEKLMRFPHHSSLRIGPACERWSTMIGADSIKHNGDETLQTHAANARREKIGPANSKWWRPVRRKQGAPIDAFSAAVTAVHALGDALGDGRIEEEDEGEDFAELV